MKKLVLIDIHVRLDGSLHLQWMKQRSDDGKEWENISPHRTSVPNGGDIDAQINLVDKDIGRMGFPPVDRADIDRAKAHAAIAWDNEAPMSKEAMVERLIVATAKDEEIAQLRAYCDRQAAELAELRKQ